MTPKALPNIPYRQWSSTCKKWSYPTRPVAMDHLRRIRAERTGREKERSAYYCKRCGAYHLTRRLVEAENDRAPELRGPSKRLVIA